MPAPPTQVTIYESDHTEEAFFPQQSVYDYLLPQAEGISPRPTYDDALPAFIDGPSGTVLTRGGLADAALRIASGLTQLGMKPGDVVSIWGRNCLEWVQAMYGCMAAGLVITPANVAYAPFELAHQMNNSGAQMMLVDPLLLPLFEATRPLFTASSFPASRVILLCDTADKPEDSPYKSLGEILGDRHATPVKLDGADAHTTAFLCYSSGTTGLPKGVMTSHFNLTSQLQAANISFPQIEWDKDVILGVLPFSHVYGLAVVLMHPVTRGVPVVILPKFDEISMLTAIQSYKITYGLIVPPIVIVLLHSKNLPHYDCSSLHTLVCAAAPLARSLQAAFNARLPHIVLMQGYGMTECSPATHSMRREEAVGRAGTVGRLLPGYQARLVDAKGHDVKPHHAGELWLRGPCVMKGYHNNAEATASTIGPGGWLRTGDILVRSQDGFWRVIDRVKELIKYKGFQVAPAELEGVLMEHPMVADAGVVGVYDASQATELPRAYIVPKEEYADYVLLPQEVQDFVAATVAGYKKLRGGVQTIDVVPKSPSGKILRKLLRERAQREYDAINPNKAKL